MKRKFAIPLTDNQLSQHFGKAGSFKVIETENNIIIGSKVIIAPQHKPGKLPQWMSEHNITHIISGGIGQKALDRLKELNIKLISGVEPEEPEILVKKFLENKLRSGLNLCDH